MLLKYIKETFSNSFQSLSSFQGPGNFVGYLFTLTIPLWILGISHAILAELQGRPQHVAHQADLHCRGAADLQHPPHTRPQHRHLDDLPWRDTFQVHGSSTPTAEVSGHKVHIYTELGPPPLYLYCTYIFSDLWRFHVQITLCSVICVGCLVKRDCGTWGNLYIYIFIESPWAYSKFFRFFLFFTIYEKKITYSASAALELAV